MTVRSCAAVLAAIFFAFIALSGCGSGGTAAAQTAAQEAESIALVCAGLGDADGESPEARTESAVDAAAALGYAAADYAGKLAFRNPELIEGYLAGAEAELSIVRICPDGGLILTKFSSGTVRSVRVALSGGEPEVTYETEHPLLYITLTEKGWLIWTEDIPDNTGTAHDGYIEPTTMLRLTPADAGLGELCDRYVGAVGYEDCGLFMCDWSAEDMSAVDFAEVFPKLYRATYGTPLTEYDSPYETEASTGSLLVSQGEFEELTSRFFAVDAEHLRALPEYDAALGAYRVRLAGVPDSGDLIYTPECVSCSDNSDGTVTLRVDAMCAALATDAAFTHELTVAVGEDGFRYVSNRVLASGGGN